MKNIPHSIKSALQQIYAELLFFSQRQNFSLVNEPKRSILYICTLRIIDSDTLLVLGTDSLVIN